ncbi:MAG: hypothetical protein ABUT20_35250 [Bacteroidota bacterium]
MIIKGKLDTAYIIFLGFLAGSILYFYFSPSTIDIHLHDTMFVISMSTILLFPVTLYMALLFIANHYLSTIRGKATAFQWLTFFAAVAMSFSFIVLPGKNSALPYLDVSFWTFYNVAVKLMSIAFLSFLAIHAAFWIYWLFNIILHTFMKPGSYNPRSKT